MCSKINGALEYFFSIIPSTVDTLVIAYSGGVDSSVLLHALANFHNCPFQCRVLHINHQLSQFASKWEQHCCQQAAAYQLPFNTETIQVTNNGKGIEAAARELRYGFFAKYVASHVMLVTAHHADDQVETVLQRLFRGTGVKGLTGMPDMRRLGKGLLGRPLLSLTRDDIEQYAKVHQLKVMTDESNFDVSLTRNRLRQQVIPELKQHFPQLRNHVLNLVYHMQAANQLLNEYTSELYQTARLSDEKQLSLTALKQLTAPQQNVVLRYWLIQMNGLQPPSYEQLLRLQREVILAREDRQPILVIDNVACRRYQDRLYLTSVSYPNTASISYQWDLSAPLETIVGTLYPDNLMNYIQLPQGALLEIRFRQGGEVFHPEGRVGSHPLKKLMQEWQIPPWLRSQMPLVYYQGQLILVGKSPRLTTWEKSASV